MLPFFPPIACFQSWSHLRAARRLSCKRILTKLRTLAQVVAKACARRGMGRSLTLFPSVALSSAADLVELDVTLPEHVSPIGKVGQPHDVGARFEDLFPAATTIAFASLVRQSPWRRNGRGVDYQRAMFQRTDPRGGGAAWSSAGSRPRLPGDADAPTHRLCR